ncbi:aminopeptidase P family protein [Pedobacter sp. AW1-32]|uniref:aminopeptidase P family protein n=1 Tax=Pedobacter sp. AW1-32 TaxID=3383026 RepID=UPI003FED8211
MFSKEIRIKRRNDLKLQIESGLLLFLGNTESPMNYPDNTYHFRQDSTFIYYFGIQLPNLNAVIDLDEDSTTLFGDEMTIDEIVWMGRQQTLSEKAAECGITDIQPSNQLHTRIAGAIKKGRKIHFLPPYRFDNKILLANLLGIPVESLNESASLPMIKAVVAQRSVKSAEEIQEIDQAACISADIHRMLMQQAKPGMYERDLVARIQEKAISNNGNLAYPAIVTVNGQILHNHFHGNMLKEGQMILNDSGFEAASGYASDLTRTFPVSKTFTPLQKEVYNVVLQAYRDAVALLKPGQRYLDVHLTACKTLAQGMKDLGLMHGNIDDAVAAGAHAMFFQCGTGHMMGLDVHDMEDLGEQYVGYTDVLKKNTTQFGLKSLRLGKELEAGYVLTIEPGIYIIPELIDLWAAEKRFSEFINYDKLQSFRNFSGIRIEDNFVVTPEGSRMLGKHLAITAEEVEQERSLAF